MKIRKTFAACLFLTSLAIGKPAHAQTSRYFPQVVNGGGYVTTWYFTGLGWGPATVTLDLFTQVGSPLMIETSKGTSSTFTFSVNPAEELSIRTSGANPTIQTGWARVTSSPEIGVAEVFQNFSGGQIVSEAGIEPSEPAGASTVIVSTDINKGRNTGVAIANIETAANPINFTLYNQSGAVVGTSKTTLDPRAQIAKFLTELPGFESFSTFEGSLVVQGLSRFSLVTLLLDGAELSTAPTLPARVSHATNSVVVPAYSNILLAGMPPGCDANGRSSVPLNSPVEAGLGLIAGKSIRVSATGTVNRGSQTLGPAGGARTQLGDVIGKCGDLPYGIADMIGPLGGLAGVFLGPSQSVAMHPPRLDFSGGAKDDLRIQPLLQQPFYIGTGSSTSGQPRDFVVPDGATRLYLAPVDLNGNNSDSTGFFSVTLSVAP